jgi:terminal oxidase subunit
VSLVGEQYYWNASETGAVQGLFNNAVVVEAGQWVSLNMTATGATQSLYLPFRDITPLQVQVVPGSVSHALFQAPSVPGVYGAPDGEYDGPWFGQDASALIVLPTNGSAGSLAEFGSEGGEGDVYDPPVLAAGSADLVANGEGLFNFSVPGPTLEAAPGPVSFSWTVPLASIGINNYLVNVTSNDPNAQQEYVVQRGGTLPFPFLLSRIDPARGLELVSRTNLSVGPTVVEHANLSAGVYLYGVLAPVAYEYDPGGESGPSSGTQSGSVMGLWGVLWVD